MLGYFNVGGSPIHPDRGHAIDFIPCGAHVGCIGSIVSSIEPQSDDRNLVQLWSDLGKESDVDLVVCVAAGLRRGIKEENLKEGFRISGLGQLVEAGMGSDRLVMFGD